MSASDHEAGVRSIDAGKTDAVHHACVIEGPLAEDGELPASRLELSRDHGEQGGLAHAVAAEQGVDAGAGELEGDVGEDRLLPEPFFQVRCGDHWYIPLLSATRSMRVCKVARS